MSETAISVTEAARNFADCVNRCHYQNMTFVLLKNGAAFARLAPVGVPACRGSELAEALAAEELATTEAVAWNRELKAARKKLKTPADRWR
jgi:hypothetical protein